MHEKDLIASFLKNVRNEKARDAFNNLEEIMRIKLENKKDKAIKELNQ